MYQWIAILQSFFRRKYTTYSKTVQIKDNYLTLFNFIPTLSGLRQKTILFILCILPHNYIKYAETHALSVKYNTHLSFFQFAIFAE